MTLYDAMHRLNETIVQAYDGRTAALAALRQDVAATRRTTRETWRATQDAAAASRRTANDERRRMAAHQRTAVQADLAALRQNVVQTLHTYQATRQAEAYRLARQRAEEHARLRIDVATARRALHADSGEARQCWHDLQQRRTAVFGSPDYAASAPPDERS